MTKEYAIEILRSFKSNGYNLQNEALNLAISALEQTNTAECVDANVKKEMEYLTAYNEGWNDCCEHYGKGDLIHRETARRIIDSPRNKEQMLGMLASITKVEKTAQWTKDDECSNCGKYVYIGDRDNFCPHCGARMKGAVGKEE